MKFYNAIRNKRPAVKPYAPSAGNKKSGKIASITGVNIVKSQLMKNFRERFCFLLGDCEDVLNCLSECYTPG